MLFNGHINIPKAPSVETMALILDVTPHQGTQKKLPNLLAKFAKHFFFERLKDYKQVTVQ